MLNFGKIKKEDLRLIQEYIPYNQYGTCDFTTLGLFMWIDYFGYEFAVDEKTLYVRATKVNPGYLPPLSKTEDNRSLQKIFQHAAALGEKEITFVCAPQSFVNQLNERSIINVQVDEAWSDYVYPIQNLALLKGKKFSKKRNLIHQFLSAYPDYKYCEITNENLKEIQRFNDIFDNGLEGSFLASYESAQTKNVIDDFFHYNLIGRAIISDGEVLGFTIAETISDTLFVHIEKANREVKGIYQLLNMCLAKEFFDKGNVKTINREEDVGDEGLKKAKASYYPQMIFKYKVVVKNEI